MIDWSTQTCEENWICWSIKNLGTQSANGSMPGGTCISRNRHSGEESELPPDSTIRSGSEGVLDRQKNCARRS